MKAYSSREIIKLLEANGWQLERCSGSHHIFKHPEIQARVVVPHPKQTLPMGTAKSILKQAGIST